MITNRAAQAMSKVNCSILFESIFFHRIISLWSIGSIKNHKWTWSLCIWHLLKGSISYVGLSRLSILPTSIVDRTPRTLTMNPFIHGPSSLASFSLTFNPFDQGKGLLCMAALFLESVSISTFSIDIEKEPKLVLALTSFPFPCLHQRNYAPFLFTTWYWPRWLS